MSYNGPEITKTPRSGYRVEFRGAVSFHDSEEAAETYAGDLMSAAALQEQVDAKMTELGCQRGEQRARAGGAVFCSTHFGWWYEGGANGCKAAFQALQNDGQDETDELTAALHSNPWEQKYDDTRTYVVTGYQDGHSRYYQRNVRGAHAQAVVDHAVAAGWTDVVASPESF